MISSFAKKVVTIAVGGALAVFGLAACSSGTSASSSGSSTTDPATVITVGASATPHAEILIAASEVLADEGYTLKVVPYNDYVLPNTALEDGELDANYFQHLTYLNGFNEENGTHLVDAADIHFEPMGIYAGKTATIEELADGATILIPNDATNEARALLLLEQEGLIKLSDVAGLSATVDDVVENPKSLNLYRVEAVQIPRVISDADLGVVNGNYALEAGLNAEDALVLESSESEAAQAYVNIIAVKDGMQDSEKIQALIAALQSDTVKQYLDDNYDGAVVAMFD